jgi:hypothetical protein
MEVRLTADIDTNEIAEEIDLCQLAGEIDLDSLAEYVDEDDVAKHIDLNELADEIDKHDVARYIDLKHLSRYLDVSQVACEFQPDVIAHHIDLEALAHKLDPDFLAEYTSPSMVADALLAKPDLGEVLYKQVAKHCPMLESPTAMFEAMTEAMCSVAMDACSEDRAAQQCGMIRMLGMISSVARCLDGTMAALRTKISVNELSTPSENDLG